MSSNPPPEKPGPKRPTQAQDAERLAEALRANLARRKAQQRARREPPVEKSPPGDDTP